MAREAPKLAPFCGAPRVQAGTLPRYPSPIHVFKQSLTTKKGNQFYF